MQLRENPKTGEVFLWDAAISTMYGIDGSPYGMKPEVIEKWERIDIEDRPAPCLQDWHDNPGYYSPAFYVQARLAKGTQVFTIGGNILGIRDYAESYGYSMTLMGCYRSRNRARAGMQVEW